ncbi:MAG: TrpR-related protein YerC/YecD [Clostridia bacterium]|nr:TrpR-related protein YerC/YecD [Clostridia bacterium]
MSDDIKDCYGELFKAILSLKTEEDCELFFSDLCTIKELNSMTQRIKAAKLLIDGETYEKIIAKTDISSATLSRVSRCVKYGKGYKKVL